MSKIFLLFALLFGRDLLAQSRINKLSLNAIDNFYSLGHSYGPQNNVVRLGDGFAVCFSTYDTLKRKRMKYEFLFTSMEAYYNNSPSQTTPVTVDDSHATLNMIFPILILYQKRIEHWFSVGVGIGTLAERDYYDQSDNLLPYNQTDLQELKFGQYWEATFLLDYELSLQWTKRIATDFGFRYTDPAPVHSNKLFYRINQGTAVGFKLGFAYKF